MKTIGRLYRSLGKSFCSFTSFFKLNGSVKDECLSSTKKSIEQFKSWGYYDEPATQPSILMAAGHGYGNVGDEAQCGACVSRWRKVAPTCQITLFSPNPAYTRALHGEQTEWAPRVAWFRSNSNGPYFARWLLFRPFFFLLRIRLELSCRFFRANLPLSLLRPREQHILQLIKEHDLIHISGGGFLTGKTRSRLWENCLLMRMCQLLNKPYMLTGHNIGVFQGASDKRIAKMALSGASNIGLRDRSISEAEIADLGITGEHVYSTCDDALLCERLDRDAVKAYLDAAGGDSNKPWIAVQFHNWGQEAVERNKIEQRFAEICDRVVTTHGLQVVFIAMTPSDIEPEQRILSLMQEKAILAPYSPDYKVVRGIIADARLVLTLKHHPIVFAQGEGVPVVAVAFDEYYYLKNKGALENTGHGDFLIDADHYYTDAVEVMIQKAIDEHPKIRQMMRTWTNKMAAIELQPYSKAVADIKKQHN
jgi:polysaccharide pyruvyl transferase WcaK-like protein